MHLSGLISHRTRTSTGSTPICINRVKPTCEQQLARQGTSEARPASRASRPRRKTAKDRGCRCSAMRAIFRQNLDCCAALKTACRAEDTLRPWGPGLNVTYTVASYSADSTLRARGSANWQGWILRGSRCHPKEGSHPSTPGSAPHSARPPRANSPPVLRSQPWQAQPLWTTPDRRPEFYPQSANDLCFASGANRRSPLPTARGLPSLQHHDDPRARSLAGVEPCPLVHRPATHRSTSRSSTGPASRSLHRPSLTISSPTLARRA